MPRQRLKMFHKKIEKYFELYFFYIGEFDVMKKYVTFYVYFSRMQNVFISDVESVF